MDLTISRPVRRSTYLYRRWPPPSSASSSWSSRWSRATRSGPASTWSRRPPSAAAGRPALNMAALGFCVFGRPCSSHRSTSSAGGRAAGLDAHDRELRRVHHRDDRAGPPRHRLGNVAAARLSIFTAFNPVEAIDRRRSSAGTWRSSARSAQTGILLALIVVRPARPAVERGLIGRVVGTTIAIEAGRDRDPSATATDTRPTMPKLTDARREAHPRPRRHLRRRAPLPRRPAGDAGRRDRPRTEEDDQGPHRPRPKSTSSAWNGPTRCSA